LSSKVESTAPPSDTATSAAITWKSGGSAGELAVCVHVHPCSTHHPVGVVLFYLEAHHEQRLALMGGGGVGLSCWRRASGV
jgi:hypothetical protein